MRFTLNGRGTKEYVSLGPRSVPLVPPTGPTGRRRRAALLATLLTVALAAALLPAVLVTTAPPVQALSGVFNDERGPRGAHDIRQVVVNNDGDLLRVSVWHHARRWKGRAVIRIDTAGDGRPEHWASIRRGYATKRITFKNQNGTRWRCSGNRWIASKQGRRLSRLVVPRRCVVGGASKLAAQVIADPASGRTDRARSGVVARFASPPTPPVPPTQTRPNVLVFMVDDMRADDLTSGAMPATQRWLGEGGTTWTNAMSPYPLCCPARASVFTGQYTHNHDVYSHAPPWGFQAFDDRSTLATWLDSAGYYTMLIGKYLNGYGAQPPPGRSSGYSHTYYPPGWDDWRGSFEGVPNHGGHHRYWDTELTLNQGRGFQRLRGLYQTDAYGDLVSQFVREQTWSATPYFSYVSFTAPHAGTYGGNAALADRDPAPVAYNAEGQRIDFQRVPVPERLWSHFPGVKAPGLGWRADDPSDRPAEMPQLAVNADEASAMDLVHRRRLQALHAVDQNVDKVMTALQQSGELAHTYVVFTSDNGYFLGEQLLRQGKLLPYEAALRVPLLIRGPGIPAGVTRHDPFLTIDLAPTILQMAGAPVPASVDGQGMLPVATGGDLGWTRPVLVNTGPSQVVRDTDESGQPLDTDDPEATDPGIRDERYLIGIRTPRYLYTHRATGFEELYDLRDDPDQSDNLLVNAGGEPPLPEATVDTTSAHPREYGTALGRLREEFQRVRACAGEACRVAMR
jgi:arylsulfatase A-like enzyme